MNKNTERKLNKKLYELADRAFINIEGRGDLETHHCDDDDFFEASVWELRTALKEAYELGRVSR